MKTLCPFCGALPGFPCVDAGGIERQTSHTQRPTEPTDAPKFICASVVGGWQSAIVLKDGTQMNFGPTFNATSELWQWQKSNLPRAIKDATGSLPVTRKQPFYRAIAVALQARQNCEKTDNREWFVRHLERIESLCKKHAPSGSGFDNGTKFDVDASTPEKLVFSVGFHHMNEHGSYDGWTHHSVTVRASLVHGFLVTVGGRDRNQIKDYICEVFNGLADLTV